MLDSRCRQTLLCLDTSSQTWKWTGGYTVNTLTHTQKQGIGRGRLADGTTAESREDVEMRVTVSWGPSSWGKITLNDWIYCIRLHKLARHVVGRPSVNIDSTIVSTSLLETKTALIVHPKKKQATEAQQQKWIFSLVQHGHNKVLLAQDS